MYFFVLEKSLMNFDGISPWSYDFWVSNMTPSSISPRKPFPLDANLFLPMQRETGIYHMFWRGSHSICRLGRQPEASTVNPYVELSLFMGCELMGSGPSGYASTSRAFLPPP
jgi:hypothetical protein